MKLSKVFSIVMIAIMLVITVSNVVFAQNIAGVIISPNSGTAGTQITKVGNRIIGIIQTVGTIAAVIVLAVIGIKYMMGSAEEKAEYKKTLMPYIIGAVLVLAAVNVVSWVSTGFTDIFNA